MTSSHDSLLQPHSPLTPSFCGYVAQRLVKAIEVFETWKLRLSSNGRVKQAVRVLQDVHTSDSFPLDEPALIRVRNAVRIGFDFSDIAKVLPDNRIPAVVEELRRAFRGTLDDVGPTEAHRAQSQLHFGAVLAAGALYPKTPPLKGSSRSPDYVITLADLDYGLEVKQPASARSATDLVRDAARQLTEYGSLYQIIAVDISDCLNLHLAPVLVAPNRLRLVEDHARKMFRALTTDVSDYMGSEGNRERFSRVVLLVVTGHTFLWLSEAQLKPYAMFIAYPEVFHWACRGLLVEQARTIRKRMMKGMEWWHGQFRHFEPPS